MPGDEVGPVGDSEDGGTLEERTGAPSADEEDGEEKDVVAAAIGGKEATDGAGGVPELRTSPPGAVLAAGGRLVTTFGAGAGVPAAGAAMGGTTEAFPLELRTGVPIMVVAGGIARPGLAGVTPGLASKEAGVVLVPG